MIVLNLWGSPSSGKSTAAAGLFYIMKVNGFNVEMAREYAKELIWEKKFEMFNRQDLIAEEQEKRVKIYKNDVDYVISDSPIPLSSFYHNKRQGEDKEFENLCWEKFNEYNNINLFINRTHTFEDFGRIHKESESEDITNELKNFLKKHNQQTHQFNSNPEINKEIFNFLIQYKLI